MPFHEGRARLIDDSRWGTRARVRADRPGMCSCGPTLDPSLDLLVVRCVDIERSRRFYEALGLRFASEKHGAGPVHYAASLGRAVLELYPANQRLTPLRFGFSTCRSEACLADALVFGGRVLDEASTRTLIEDPDGLKVEIRFHQGST